MSIASTQHSRHSSSSPASQAGGQANTVRLRSAQNPAKMGMEWRYARLNPQPAQRFLALEVLLRGILLTLLLAAPLACYGQRVAVQTELIAEIRQAVPAAGGASTAYRFVRATVVPQGEVVYYTVRVRNPSAAYARNVVVVQKIPENTTYVAGSAAGPAVEVTLSADGGRTFAAERRTAADGQSAEASPQYTHIRWRFRNALAPGATALARFRAVFR